jgi:hypothetical protein
MTAIRRIDRLNIGPDWGKAADESGHSTMG